MRPAKLTPFHSGSHTTVSEDPPQTSYSKLGFQEGPHQHHRTNRHQRRGADIRLHLGSQAALVCPANTLESADVLLGTLSQT